MELCVYVNLNLPFIPPPLPGNQRLFSMFTPLFLTSLFLNFLNQLYKEKHQNRPTIQMQM